MHLSFSPSLGACKLKILTLSAKRYIRKKESLVCQTAYKKRETRDMRFGEESSFEAAFTKKKEITASKKRLYMPDH